ncbi:glycosyltransferase [Paenibacillus thiaminolyticus]|uniref:glycosyltransferase family 2 protein n=1 Tax=Paenibacillus thiaminolyticus TaxID=49283 RepID=UPI00232F0622|nr:glycosyltransferase [Paenibacillus thiaminolyticus]WCF07931.1 glycosyltransferase [Paenibacillus thiaminolyticus]
MASVSVIVPVYNVEAYLRRCLDSLVMQTLEDIEIIVVNDASPDRSIEIMKEYQHKYPDKITVIDSNVNLRQGGARNLGIRASRSEYIGFVDSDDWVDVNMYEQLYTTAIEKDADVVSCNMIRVLNEEECFPFYQRDLSAITGTLDAGKREEIMLNGASPGVVSKIYRKNLIYDHDIWFPERLFYEDNLWGALIFLYARNYYHLNEAFYYYYYNDNSTVASIESMHHFDRLVIETMKLDEYRKRGFYEQYKDAIEYSFIQLYYINSLHLAFTRFNRPPFTKVFEMRKYMKDHFPNYRHNKYFGQINEIGRMLSGITDLSPYKAYEWYKSVLMRGRIE